MFQTFTGLEYLKMDIAANHKKECEKANWDDRIRHFYQMGDLRDEANVAQLCEGANNPVGLRAAILAYQDTLADKATGYMISLDAHCSVLQILSLLMSCEKSFKLCGGDSDNLIDTYSHIYEAMDLEGTQIGRKALKAAIMESCYGSDTKPAKVFGDDEERFYEIMDEEMPGAWSLSGDLVLIWNDLDTPGYSWFLPDNFYAEARVTEMAEETFEFMGETKSIMVHTDERADYHKGCAANIVHSIDGFIVREMFRRCMFDMDTFSKVVECLNATGTNGKHEQAVQTLWGNYLASGFLSVRILDYLDEGTMGLVDPLVIAELLQSLPDAPFDIVTIHDCFRCHANNGNDVRRQYNRIMADISGSNILKFIVSAIFNEEINVAKTGTIDRATIVDANYMIG